jgi:hypothetical protein
MGFGNTQIPTDSKSLSGTVLRQEPINIQNISSKWGWPKGGRCIEKY